MQPVSADGAAAAAAAACLEEPPRRRADFENFGSHDIFFNKPPKKSTSGEGIAFNIRKGAGPMGMANAGGFPIGQGGSGSLFLDC